MDLGGDVVTAARSLLGAELVARGVRLRLSEVEAYAGPDDPASHAWRGPTPRTRVMFGPPGRLYVYRSYGLHWCANVVTGPEGTASAVLLRAAAVVDGGLRARERRGPAVESARLARGPANLTSAAGITGADDGLDLCGWDGPLRLVPRADAPPVVRCGPRVGVSRAADVPWRFWVEGEASVSAYRRSPRAPAG